MSRVLQEMQAKRRRIGATQPQAMPQTAQPPAVATAAPPERRMTEPEIEAEKAKLKTLMINLARTGAMTPPGQGLAALPMPADQVARFTGMRSVAVTEPPVRAVAKR